MSNPLVTLVNENGKSIGTADRASAHHGAGKLHRAFSIFVFKKLCHGEPRRTTLARDTTYLLLQKRAPHKLFGNFWTNTCCSHPRPEEEILDAAKRRLQEEFGIACDLKECGSFIYKAHDEKGTEYEYDTVLTGEISDNTALTPDIHEIAEWKWMNIKQLEKDLIQNPQHYTPWLKQALLLAYKPTRLPA